MLMPSHDPRDPACRCPGGAVPGGAVRLSLTVPVLFAPDEVTLCAALDAEHTTWEIPMRRVPYTPSNQPACIPFSGAGFRRFPVDDPDWPCDNGRHQRWSAELDCAGYRGLVFYWFRLRRGTEAPYFLLPMEPTPEQPYLLSRIGEVPTHPEEGWQITVYDPEYQTPEWFGKGVTYQIFPDRFARVGALPTADAHHHYHENLTDTPEYAADAAGNIPNDDFFGGNLAGIREKLPYLASLGVTALYLNPIFEARSNHRYDTADYARIDPLLGTEQDFADLCADAKILGIRILLDGVFNHTGSVSRYFNADGSYPDVGAAQSTDSPYYSWYSFRHWPEDYECWWGVKILPKVRGDSGFADYILDTVARKWLRAGASGWRLDVADELTEDFLTKFRRAVREEKPDAPVLGEVWEDASNKISYGSRRHYLEGAQLDGVMNYPLAEAIFAYLRGGDAFCFARDMETLLEHYPKPARRCLLNLLGAHDTVRALTRLGCEHPPASRDARAAYSLTEAERERGIRRLRLASAIQYLFPGSPDLYYGDEAGLEGFEDPFNRRYYPWGRENAALLHWYRTLGRLRREYPQLADAETVFPYAAGAVLAVARVWDTGGLLLLVNAGAEEQPFPEECRIPRLTPLSRFEKLPAILPGESLYLCRFSRV